MVGASTHKPHMKRNKMGNLNCKWASGAHLPAWRKTNRATRLKSSRFFATSSVSFWINIYYSSFCIYWRYRTNLIGWLDTVVRFPPSRKKKRKISSSWLFYPVCVYMLRVQNLCKDLVLITFLTRHHRLDVESEREREMYIFIHTQPWRRNCCCTVRLVKVTPDRFFFLFFLIPKTKKYVSFLGDEPS